MNKPRQSSIEREGAECGIVESPSPMLTNCIRISNVSPQGDQKTPAPSLSYNQITWPSCEKCTDTSAKKPYEANRRNIILGVMKMGCGAATPWFEMIDLSTGCDCPLHSVSNACYHMCMSGRGIRM